MKDFSEFIASVTENPEFTSTIMHRINSKMRPVLVPEDIIPQETLDAITGNAASVSFEISLLMLQAYHNWLSDQS